MSSEKRIPKKYMRPNASFVSRSARFPTPKSVAPPPGAYTPSVTPSYHDVRPSSATTPRSTPSGSTPRSGYQRGVPASSAFRASGRDLDQFLILRRDREHPNLGPGVYDQPGSASPAVSSPRPQTARPSASFVSSSPRISRPVPTAAPPPGAYSPDTRTAQPKKLSPGSAAFKGPGHDVDKTLVMRKDREMPNLGPGAYYVDPSSASSMLSPRRSFPFIATQPRFADTPPSTPPVGAYESPPLMGRVAPTASAAFKGTGHNLDKFLVARKDRDLPMLGPGLYDPMPVEGDR